MDNEAHPNKRVGLKTQGRFSFFIRESKYFADGQVFRRLMVLFILNFEITWVKCINKNQVGRAREEIEKILSELEITQVKSLPGWQRDHELIKIKTIEGHTLRQAARGY